MSTTTTTTTTRDRGDRYMAPWNGNKDAYAAINVVRVDDNRASPGVDPTRNYHELCSTEFVP